MDVILYLNELDLINIGMYWCLQIYKDRLLFDKEKILLSLLFKSFIALNWIIICKMNDKEKEKFKFNDAVHATSIFMWTVIIPLL